MKFTCQIELNANASTAAKLYRDADLFKEWQDGFKSYQLLSDSSDTKGSTAKVVYQNGKQLIELIETVVENKLPEKFLATYEHKHMDNSMLTCFKAMGEERSSLLVEVHYYQFHHWLPKLMAFFFPGLFKKQVQKWLNQFRVLAEQ